MDMPQVSVCRVLYPLSVVYGWGIGLRNWLFDKGVLSSRRYPLPVICIGNLAVGGTGKTPHTEYLIRLLRGTCQVAVLSRGYRRKSKGFVLADAATTAAQIGDEPYQMARKFPDVYVAVDADRCEGIERLTDGATVPGVDVILLDDAFQHRYVRPGLSVLLTDYRRPFFRDALLPAGRLREPMKGRRRADVIIVSKCPSALTREERQWYLQELAPLAGQQVFFTSLVYGTLQPLFASLPARSLDSLRKEEHVLLLTGIASPVALLDELSSYTSHIVPLTFADHHDFSVADVRRIEAAFAGLPEEHRLVVTTEKDASRLVSLPGLSETLKACLYVLPVEVAFGNHDQERFNQLITEYVRENTRSCRFSEKEDAVSS